MFLFRSSFPAPVLGWLCWAVAEATQGNAQQFGGDAPLPQGLLIRGTVAGSSTVLPIAERWAAWLRREHPSSEVLVDHQHLGSSEGASRLCNGEVEIGSMSRDWHPSEAAIEQPSTESVVPIYSCVGSPVRVAQLHVAWDAIVVLVQRNGAADRCLREVLPVSLELLRRIFAKPDDDQPCKFWSDVINSPLCPQTCIEISGPGTKSGTLRMFQNAVHASPDTWNTIGYHASEEHTAIVTRVLESGNAIGFVGYSYFHSRSGLLSLIPVEQLVRNEFCACTVTGHYPLARPLFMNVVLGASNSTLDFLKLGFSDVGQDLVTDAGSCRLHDQDRHNGEISLTKHFSTSFPSDTGILASPNVSSITSDLHIGLVVIYLCCGCMLGLVIRIPSRLSKGRCSRIMEFRSTSGIQSNRPCDQLPDMELQMGPVPSQPEPERIPSTYAILSLDASPPSSPRTSSHDSSGRAHARLYEQELASSSAVSTHFWEFEFVDIMAFVHPMLTWSDVKSWFATSSASRGSRNHSSANLEALLNESGLALKNDGRIDRALRLWTYCSPQLHWASDGRLRPEGLVALLWSVGVLAMHQGRPATKLPAWHVGLAHTIMFKRAGWGEIRDQTHGQYASLQAFVTAGALPNLSHYCAWVAAEGGYLSIQGLDLIPVLIDLDPGLAATPLMPTQALRCAQGELGVVKLRGRWYAFPESAWKKTGRADSSLGPEVSLFQEKHLMDSSSDEASSNTTGTTSSTF